MRQKTALGVIITLIVTFLVSGVLYAEEKIETIHIGPEDRYYGEVDYMRRVTENGRLTRMEVYFTDSYIDEKSLVYQYEYSNKEGRIYRLDYRFADSYGDYWGIDSFYKYIDGNNNTTKCGYRFYDGTEVYFEGERLDTIFTFIPKKASSHFEDYFFIDGRKNGETVIASDKEASSLVKISSRLLPLDTEEKNFLEEWLQTSEGNEYDLSDFTKKIRADEDGEEIAFLVHSSLENKMKQNEKCVICYYYAGGVYPRPFCVAVEAWF